MLNFNSSTLKAVAEQAAQEAAVADDDQLLVELIKELLIDAGYPQAHQRCFPDPLPTIRRELNRILMIPCYGVWGVTAAHIALLTRSP
jgi:hypothetical protein